METAVILVRRRPHLKGSLRDLVNRLAPARAQP
jgi:hypothetical protein